MLVIFFTRVAGCTRCSKVTAGDWNNFTKCRKKFFLDKNLTLVVSCVILAVKIKLL